MASFSIGEALGAGFGLIRRHPLSVLLWGIAYTVLTLIPFALLIPLLGPDVISLLERASAGAADLESSSEVAALNLKAQMIQPLSIACSLLASGMLNAAIFRAVLEPENKGFFYLRVGKDEFWQAVVSLAVGILFVAVFFAVAMLAAMVGAALWFAIDAAGGGALRGIAIAVPGAGAVILLMWLALRFSLAAPATFATRSFQLFESWTLTRGQGGRLFGLALLLLLVCLGLYLVLAVIVGVAAVATGVSLALNREAVEAFFLQDPMTIISTLAPLIAVVWAISALISGAIYAILIAPWASVYRQVTAGQSRAGGI